MFVHKCKKFLPVLPGNAWVAKQTNRRQILAELNTVQPNRLMSPRLVSYMQTNYPRTMSLVQLGQDLVPWFPKSSHLRHAPKASSFITSPQAFIMQTFSARIPSFKACKEAQNYYNEGFLFSWVISPVARLLFSEQQWIHIHGLRSKEYALSTFLKPTMRLQ